MILDDDFFNGNSEVIEETIEQQVEKEKLCVKLIIFLLAFVRSLTITYSGVSLDVNIVVFCLKNIRLWLEIAFLQQT